MFARFDRMAKAFTRIGKDIAIAVKLGGANPDNNPRLRMAIQNAKGVNMPKDRVDAAIRRASSKEEKAFQEVIYEGYAPHGVPVLIECATDNPTRTVANIRLRFSKNGGTISIKKGSREGVLVGQVIIDIPKRAIEITDELTTLMQGRVDEKLRTLSKHNIPAHETMLLFYDAHGYGTPDVLVQAFQSVTNYNQFHSVFIAQSFTDRKNTISQN